ncbi:CTP synthetase [Candidatus Woesearchaeota archaeon]|nr:CTP synthetase [Candidatus Woesearchaeota archaeon]|tara:strand:- start:43184 stop:44824 length:1641 start_codon:yes stop_codon:yes gene_type:complete
MHTSKSNTENSTKWIIVTGGVISGLGKGISAAAIGKLLSGNFKVVPIKCDGYLNIDPGTMNPFEHGEVFVLEDGGEVDMDFGHYERFLNINCKSGWNLTTGKIFDSIIKQERKGEFLGKTVQVIPHLTNEIKRQWMKIAKEEKADVMTIEIGGTVGDIENSWFVEAARQLKKDIGSDNVLYVHLSYVPFVKTAGQQKTKPAQRDVQLLRETGIVPDIMIGRSEVPLTKESKSKLALYCDVLEEAVISAPDVKTIYELPITFEEEGILRIISKKFNFTPKTNLEEWKKLIGNIKNHTKTINIALCGKYTGLTDAYASLIESLNHAGAHLSTKVNVELIETTDIEEGKVPIDQLLADKDAIIVPIGFGSRGAEGKISTVRYAREHNIPFLGLCFGLQIAVIEFARNVCGFKDANSTEIDPKTKDPVVMILPEQMKIIEKGGTMRLGAEKSILKRGTKTTQLYGNTTVYERHRHRYEVNPKYHKILEKHGMVISGSSRNGKLVEFIELPNLKFFAATQAHPEYKSRLETPSPLYYGLVKAAVEKKYGRA